MPPLEDPLGDLIQAADQRIWALQKLAGAQLPTSAELCSGGLGPIGDGRGENAQPELDLLQAVSRAFADPIESTPSGRGADVRF